MRNEETREFTSITEQVADVMIKGRGCKLVFREGEVLEVKGRNMQVLHVYRRSIVLRPVGW